MKTKSIFVLVALLALNIQSCDKYLDEKLVSDVSAFQGYYTSAQGFDDALDATYYYMKFVYSNERAYSMTVFGTDTYTNGADGGYKSFNFYDNGLRSDVDILQQMWQYCYQGVNQANAVVERAGDVKDMTDAVKNVKVAEARFLRALYYFTLTRQWGDVPVSLKETIAVIVEAPKVPQAGVYDVIVADLEFAVANLPKTQPDYGRATLGAANHLLGLVRLTRGYTSFAKSDDFSTAETLFGSVIGGGYALTSDIAKLWDQDNQKNSEIIFAVQNSTNVLLNSGGDGVLPGEGNRGHLYFLHQYDIQPGMTRDIAGGRPFKRFRPTKYLLDLWEAARPIDNRYDLTYRHVWYANNKPPDINNYPVWTDQNITDGAYKYDATIAGPTQLVKITAADKGKPRFALGDTAIYIPGPANEAKWTATRLKQTRYKVFTRNPNLVSGGTSATMNYDDFNFAHTNKFADPRRPTIQWQEGSRDWFVMRLADTYLLRAEARYKQGKNALAADDINVVRTRAAKPGQVAAMQITPANVTMDFILDERAKELDGEQCRWYDLTRTLTFVDRVRLYNPLAAANVKPYHARRPYPQTQVDRTFPQGSFTQNCGYSGIPECN